MNKCVFLLILSFGSLQGNVMQDLIASNVPLREDGKMDIPQNIKHIKLDIGLSYNAPISQYWLSHEKDLLVFGFEPDLSSVNSILEGASKRNISHGDPLDLKYVGKSFFLIPCALGLQSGSMQSFYKTKVDCGCSSLYPPKYLEIAEVVEVPVFRLSDFFELFPFDTHPVVDYIKIDAQGSDLDIVKGGGRYLEERVIYITIEAEDYHYENTTNSEGEIDDYMKKIGFERFYSHETSDPTYFNPRFLDYVQKHEVKIFQKG